MWRSESGCQGRSCSADGDEHAFGEQRNLYKPLKSVFPSSFHHHQVHHTFTTPDLSHTKLHPPPTSHKNLQNAILRPILCSPRHWRPRYAQQLRSSRCRGWRTRGARQLRPNPTCLQRRKRSRTDQLPLQRPKRDLWSLALPRRRTQCCKSTFPSWRIEQYNLGDDQEHITIHFFPWFYEKTPANITLYTYRWFAVKPVLDVSGFKLWWWLSTRGPWNWDFTDSSKGLAACSGKFSTASLSRGVRIKKRKTRPFHVSLESRERIMNIKTESL